MVLSQLILLFLKAPLSSVVSMVELRKTAIYFIALMNFLFLLVEQRYLITALKLRIYLLEREFDEN